MVATSSDKPFKMRGGDTEQAAMYNRIAAIERIKVLCGVDLRDRSKYYLYALDMEMYQRWYKDYPKDHKIDEQWCHRAAEVVKSMEEYDSLYNNATEMAGRVASAFKSHENLPLKQPLAIETKETFLKGLHKVFNKIIKGDKQ